jgi:outer membrane receptor protein involved in Fe transport
LESVPILKIDLIFPVLYFERVYIALCIQSLLLYAHKLLTIIIHKYRGTNSSYPSVQILIHQLTMKKSIRYLFIFVFLFSCSLALSLQGHAQGTLSGTVTDSETGEVLIGVNILVLNEGLGVATEGDGDYEITNIPAGNYQIEARYIGYNSVVRDVTIENGVETVLNFELVISTSQLNELVVTSFGLQQEKKALGYSVQEIDSENLTAGNQSNVVNALSGKVSGVQITNTGGAPGRSSRIIIRGVNSLDPSADNQPLFVVDGVPIDNSTIESSGTPRGMSNRAADLNPNDIQSVNV